MIQKDKFNVNELDIYYNQIKNISDKDELKDFSIDLASLIIENIESIPEFSTLEDRCESYLKRIRMLKFLVQQFETSFSFKNPLSIKFINFYSMGVRKIINQFTLGSKIDGEIIFSLLADFNAQRIKFNEDTVYITYFMVIVNVAKYIVRKKDPNLKSSIKMTINELKCIVSERSDISELKEQLIISFVGLEHWIEMFSTSKGEYKDMRNELLKEASKMKKDVSYFPLLSEYNSIYNHISTNRIIDILQKKFKCQVIHEDESIIRLTRMDFYGYSNVEIVKNIEIKNRVLFALLLSFFNIGIDEFGAFLDKEEIKEDAMFYTGFLEKNEEIKKAMARGDMREVDKIAYDFMSEMYEEYKKEKTQTSQRSLKEEISEVQSKLDHMHLDHKLKKEIDEEVEREMKLRKSSLHTKSIKQVSEIDEIEIAEVETISLEEENSARLDELIERLKSEDLTVKLYATVELIKIVGKKKLKIEPIVELLDDPVGKIRGNAVRILGKMQPEEVKKHLRTALSDTDKFVREQAVKALGGIGDIKSIETLEDLRGKGSVSETILEQTINKLRRYL